MSIRKTVIIMIVGKRGVNKKDANAVFFCISFIFDAVGKSSFRECKSLLKRVWFFW